MGRFLGSWAGAGGFFLNSGRSSFCWWTRGLKKRTQRGEWSLLRMASDALPFSSYVFLLLGLAYGRHCSLFLLSLHQVPFTDDFQSNHVGLTILLFSFHQKTVPKGHGKRLTKDGGVSMETWVEQLSAQQTPPQSCGSSGSSSERGISSLLEFRRNAVEPGFLPTARSSYLCTSCLY